MSKMQDSKLNPPPAGTGDVWAYCVALETHGITPSRDVRECPSIYPQWRPLNNPRR